jgi:pyruvate/2-oxoglutarate dehydrogenase complex dihydrolipoamide acyltransferase (E2) component
MTEGSVTDWKVAVGESFKAGDVLLSIETDKAAIDVEAMDDGVMGKILVSYTSMQSQRYQGSRDEEGWKKWWGNR